MPLAILTIRKELHGFLFLCIRVVPFSIIMGLRSGRRSSTIRIRNFHGGRGQGLKARSHGCKLFQFLLFIFFYLVPTQFTVFPQSLQVIEPNPIVLSCDASGFPEPSFVWMKDGRVVSKSKQLNIQRSERTYSGIYVCTASNGVGKDKMAKAYVTVQCKSLTYRITVVYPCMLYTHLNATEAVKKIKHFKSDTPRPDRGIKLQKPNVCTCRIICKVIYLSFQFTLFAVLN